MCVRSPCLSLRPVFMSVTVCVNIREESKSVFVSAVGG